MKNQIVVTMDTMKENRGAFAPVVQELLVREATVGGDVLDRAFFYELTRDWSQGRLDALRERASACAKDFYRALAAEGRMGGKMLGDALAGVDRVIGAYFDPVERLLGKMDSGLEARNMSDRPLVDEKGFSSFAEAFLPEVEALRREGRTVPLDRWCADQCVRFSWDYTLLSGPLKSEQQVQYFIDGHPYLVESRQADVVRRGFALCSPSGDADLGDFLKAAPGPRVYVGDGLDADEVIGFSRFTDPSGRESRYVVFAGKDVDGHEKCPVEDLPRADRLKVLELLHRTALRHSRRQSAVLKRRPSGPKM